MYTLNQQHRWRPVHKSVTNSNLLQTKSQTKSQSFVHISTAYCNAIKHDIEEKVYEHNVSVENILSANR